MSRMSEINDKGGKRMNLYVKSELLKNKKSQSVRLLWAMPIVCFIIAILLMNGTYVQILAWNWWYMLFLPFVIAYVCMAMLRRDKKKNFHGLFGIVEKKEMLGYGKVIVATIYLAVTNFCFWGMTLVSEYLLGTQVGIVNSLIGSIVLTITVAWQIPFFLLLSIKCNLFIGFVVSLFCNFLIACMCATESFWWIPFAIPARMMCHIVGILPNGLLVEETMEFGGNSVVFIGIVLTTALYFAMTLLFGKAFRKQEV